MRKFLALATAAVLLSPAFAQTSDKSTSPIGMWKTIDDKTGQPRGIVRVYETDGRYFARIERSLVPGEEGKQCTACTDERKDQPFIGLVLMRNVKLENGEYAGGGHGSELGAIQTRDIADPLRHSAWVMPVNAAPMVVRDANPMP